MASGNFILGVSAQITNLNDVQNQLKNLKLTKSISVPVELKGGQQAIRTINTFKDSIGQTVREVQTFNTATGNTTSSIKSVSLNIEKANKAINPFGNGLEKIIKTGAKVAVFSVLASAINSVKNAMASTIDIVKDFDDALTEFKKVSDLSGEALNNYAKQLGELGSTVARTRTELLEGASSFRKMGFTDAESAKLAQTNAMFQNISDSEMSAEESARILIGTMKGFDLTASSVEHIADVINEVSNTSAVSSTDIASGLANVSAVSKAMGNSLEETVGMLTAMTEVSQSAGKSSRGLRQIMTRLSQTLDDSSKTGKDLREIYKSLGVEIFDQQGQIKSTTQILGGLAEHWKDLSRNEQENIALKSAGSNQINNFLALLDHWDRAVEATNTALESNGSAMRENERYMESLSAKLSHLRSQFEELVLGDGVISSFIKSVVDAGTAVLKFANTDLGQAIIMATALTTVIMNLAKAYEMLGKSKALTESVNFLSKAFQGVATSATAAAGATASAEAGMAGVGAAASASCPPILIAIGIVAALTATIYGAKKAYDFFNPSINKTKQALDEANQAYETSTQEISTLEQQISNIKKQIEETNAKKLEITDPKQKEQLDQQLKILERQTAQAQVQLSIARQKQAVEKANIEREAKKAVTQKREVDYKTFEYQPLANGQPAELVLKTRKAYTDATSALNIYIDSVEKAQSVIEENNKKIEELNNLETKTAEEKEQVKEQIESLNDTNEKALVIYNDSMEKMGDYIDVVDNISKSNQEGNEQAQKTLDRLSEVTSITAEASNASSDYSVVLHDLNEDLEENSDQADENAQKQEELAQKNEALNASLSAVSKAMKPVEKAQKEFAKNGKITSDTIIGIQSKAQKLDLDFTNLMGVLSDTNSTTQDVNEAFGSMIQQIVEASGAFDNLTEENADTVVSLLEGYGVTNAYTIVQQKLAEQLVNSKVASDDFQVATMKDVAELQNISKVSQVASRKLFEYVNAKIRANQITIQTDGDIKQLIALANAAGVAAEKVAQAKAAVATVEKYHSKSEVVSRAINPITSSFNKEKNQQYKSAFDTVKQIKEGTFFDAESALEYKYEPLDPNSFIVNATNSSGGGSGTGGSGGSGGKTTDPVEEAKKQAEEFKKLHKQILDDRLKYLDHELKQEVISVEEHNELKKKAYGQYFWALKEQGIDYLQEQNEFFDEQREWMDKRFEDSIKYQQHLIDRQIKALQKEKDAESDDYDEQIEHLEEKRDKIVDALDEEIDLREEQKEAELDAIKEEQDAIKKKHDEVIDNIKAQIDVLKEEKSANKEAWDERIAQLDAVNDELEKQKQLEEKLEALAKARATRVKVFRNGRFVYDVDREAVSEAQKNLNEYKEKLRQERAKKSLQDQRDAEQKNYDERIDALEKYKDQQDKYYDDIENRLEDHYDAVDKKYEELLNALKKQRDSEKKLYDDKIKNLQKLKKEQEKEYQDMIDDLNELKDSYSDALEDMENAQNGFLDASKAFAYDYSKSLEENLQNFMTYVNGIKSGYNQLQQSAQSAYSNISNYSNPAEQHQAWVDAGSPSSSSSSSSGYNTYGYGDVVTKKSTTSASFPTHANGISSIGNNEIAIVGENPNKEIVVGSRVNNGTLMSLNRGTGVINAKSTRTLAGLVNSIGGSNNLIDRNTSIVQTFSFDKIVLPNVTNANSFVDALSHEFNNRAIQYGNIRR